MKEPLVSIIMPAHNSERYIKTAIESVQQLSVLYRVGEIIT